MEYRIKLIINGVEVLEEQNREKMDGVVYSAPSIFGVKLQNNATLKTMEIGATACDCLSFTMMNPFMQSFDGQKVEFYVKPITTVEESAKARIEAAVGTETTASSISEAANNTNTTPDEEEGEELTAEELADVEQTAEANVEDTFSQLEGEADATTPGAVTESEWHKVGVYYVQFQETLEDNKIRLTCYDGFVQLNGLWTPSSKTGPADVLFNDLRAQILNDTGIIVEPFEFGDIPIEWKTMSSYRTALGYFAGLVGGFVGFDSDGDAAINFYGYTDNILIKEELLNYTEDSAGEMLLTEISCNISLDGVNEKILEAGAGQGISFNNPYMTQNGLEAILTDYTGIRFTGGSIGTRWNESLMAGEFIKIFTADEYDNYLRLKNAYNAGETDLKESINSLGTVMLISSQVITFGGDAVSNITSVCSSEAAKENTQLSPSDAKFRNLYANSITTETLEAGTAEIQRLISENVDASQIKTGTLDADIVNIKNINGNEIKNGSVLAAALSQEAVQTIGGNKVYYQAEAPTGGVYIEGDTWYKTVIADSDEDKKVLHIWDGSAWIPSDFDARVLRANTITAQEIASNTITANNINMDNLQTNIVRIGASTGNHIEIDSDSLDIMDGTETLAQFGVNTSTYSEPMTYLSTNNVSGGLVISANYEDNGGVSSVLMYGKPDTQNANRKVEIEAARISDNGMTWPDTRITAIADETESGIVINAHTNSEYMATDYIGFLQTDAKIALSAPTNMAANSTIDLNADIVKVNGVEIPQQLSKLELTVSTHTGTTGTIASGAMGEGSFTATKAGWYPLGIVGYGTANGSGSGSSYAIINIFRLTGRTTGSCTVNWRIRAYSGQVKTNTLNADILWMRTV